MKNPKMKAVITADIIEFSRLSGEEADFVLEGLHELFKEMSGTRFNIRGNFSIKRGDSIQGEIEDSGEALRVALLLKAAVNKLNPGNRKGRKPGIDVRIAIGTGKIENKRREVNESSGTAYIRSGRTLDAMKKSRKMVAFKSENPDLDEEIETELRLLEVIMSGWKRTSAEVIYWTLSGYSEKEVSNILKISQSAVNQRKRTAGWSGIEAFLKRYRKLLKQGG